ncbi:ROK family protein [Erysipelothrix rhusiopathiae]|uniref:ROK family protein n=1 Tax=Erysipelothrix rhusiopathiae TaxID=1648 RepID=UPI00202AD152|nr:ROK family transcriptional regulator [Erysipelothrix rhusiopathiae]URQ77510.1 ROK family protein [Erysipelothrix rhusiopathiae]
MQLSKAKTKQTALILDLLYSKGPLSRIDISKSLHITPATVSDLTQHLINDKIICEIGEDTDNTRVGRRKILLGLLPNHSYYLGVELFEHSFTLALSDNLNEICFEEAFTLSKSDHVRHDLLVKTINDFLKKHSDTAVTSIGIAIPGHYDKTSSHILTNNHSWANFSLDYLKKHLKYPVYFENNVNAMAIRERLFGHDKTDANFLFLHFRRGIFCSYVYQGDLYARNNYFVGEIGHLVVNPFGEQCECGKIGCLQTYASQTWLLHKASLLFNSSANTYLKQLVNEEHELSMDILLQAYHLGDSAVIQLLENAINFLAIALNNIIVTLDTDIIYLHGQLFDDEQLSALLLNKIREHDSEFISRQTIQKEIKPYSKANGARAACALAISETLLCQ